MCIDGGICRVDKKRYGEDACGKWLKGGFVRESGIMQFAFATSETVKNAIIVSAKEWSST